VKARVNKLAPIHPGEIFHEEFMKPRDLSQKALARALNVPPRRINEIVLEKRGITADTGLRLARFFGTSAEMWTGNRVNVSGLARENESHSTQNQDAQGVRVRPVQAVETRLGRQENGA